MADKQGVLGARSESKDADGAAQPPGPGRDEREAYEEDWYRSLRALAERQQRLAEPDPDLQDEAAELEQPSPEGELAAAAADEPTDGHLEDADAAFATGPELSAAEPEAPDGEPVDREPHLRIVPDPSEAEPETELPAFEDGPIAPAGEPPGAVPDEPETAQAPDEPAGWTPTPSPFARLLETPAETEPAPEEAMRPVPEDGTWQSPITSEPPAAEPSDEAAVEALPDEPSADAPSPEEAPAAAVADEAPAPAESLEAPAVKPEPSLSSTDPQDRRSALDALAAQELSDGETRRVEAMLLDPETDIRRAALGILLARPERVDEQAIHQALQDPTDDVRAVAVELAARRGDVWQIAPLLAARDWPNTHRAVLEALPAITADSSLDDRALGRVLDAVGNLDPGPLPDEEPAIGRIALAIGTRRILDALSWPDVPRLGAIRLLARDRSPDVLRELAAHDGDPIEEIREIAIAATVELTEAEAERERVAAAAMERLVEAQEASERDRVAEAAPRPEEGTERITSLARALLDHDGTVRHLALSGLAGMERSAIVSWVRDSIASREPSQVVLVASTAQMLRLVEGAADLLDAAAELSGDGRHRLLEALTSFVMPPEQLAGLLSEVREPHQPEAIRMLWRVGGPPLLSHLRPYLDDPSTPVRQAVLDVFAESGDPAAVDVARIALETDVSPAVRARAVRMMAHFTSSPPPGTVVRALSDPDPEVRATAIETLPDVEGAEAIDALTSSLSDPDDRVRLAAAKRLAVRAADPEVVWSALRRAPETGRGDIIASFERVRSGSLTQMALERLRSPDQEERTLAIEVCGWGSSPGCVEAAIQALADPSALVRRAATLSLGRLRDPAAANALGKALGDPDPEVRIGVVQALGVIDDEAVLGFLVSALNDPDARVRDVTSQVLTEWSSPAVARRLAGVLAVPRLREAATDLLTRIGPPAVELLIDVLLQHNPAVVPTVGELLQRIARPEDFVTRLDAVEPERRLRGIEALGAIGGVVAAEALLRSVSDPDDRIRARAAQLLAEVQDPRAPDALVGLLRDPIPGVVAAAQEALTRLSSGSG